MIEYKASIVPLGDYDTCERALTLAGWEELYFQKTGRHMNLGTLRKRRYVSGLGYLVPPKTYLLSRDEFERVVQTPLPMCKNTVSGIMFTGVEHE